MINQSQPLIMCIIIRRKEKEKHTSKVQGPASRTKTISPRALGGTIILWVIMWFSRTVPKMSPPETVFPTFCELIQMNDRCHSTNLKIAWFKFPNLFSVETRWIDTTRNVDRFWHFLNLCQRSLNAIKDVIQNTRSKFDWKGSPSSEDGITNCETSYKCQIWLNAQVLTDRFLRRLGSLRCHALIW